MRLLAALLLLPLFSISQVDKNYLTNEHIEQAWQVDKVTVQGKEVIMPNIEEVKKKQMVFKNDRTVTITSPSGNSVASWQLDAANNILNLYTATSSHTYAIMEAGKDKLTIKQLPDQPEIHLVPITTAQKAGNQ